MNLIAQTVADGLVLGGIYALAAVGFSLIFGVLHVINCVVWVVDAVALPFGVGYWFWLPRWGPADLLRPPNVNFASLVSVGVVVVNVLLVGLSKLVVRVLFAASCAHGIGYGAILLMVLNLHRCRCPSRGRTH